MTSLSNVFDNDLWIHNPRVNDFVLTFDLRRIVVKFGPESSYIVPKINRRLIILFNDFSSDLSPWLIFCTSADKFHYHWCFRYSGVFRLVLSSNRAILWLDNASSRPMGHLYSLSGKTSYRKIPWSPRAARFGIRLFTLKFDGHFSSSAAEMPIKFLSDAIIITSNLSASKLHEILR